MARLLTFRKEYPITSAPGTVAPLDGTVNFDIPLRLTGKGLTVRLISASFSSTIPNVFNYGGWNNTVIGISRDNGTTMNALTLPAGIYTIAYINQALQQTTIDLGWWAPAVPQTTGINLAYNLATDTVYLNLDSTKLAIAGQLYIDFGFNGSDMWKTLGFASAAQAIIHVDGLTSAQTVAQLDTFTADMNINLNGFGALSTIGNRPTNTLAVVSLLLQGGTHYLYPSGQAPLPNIALWSTDLVVPSYSMEFTGSNGRQLLWMPGSYMEVSFAIEPR